LIEQFGRQQVSFVDDEENVAALASQIVKGCAKLGWKAQEAIRWFDLEGEEDLAVEGSDTQVGVGKVHDSIDMGIERLGEGPGGGGFSRSNVSGEESGRATREGEVKTALSLAVTARGVEILGGDRFGEGSLLEAIEFIQAGHRISPLG
jgi:hypothetical protein